MDAAKITAAVDHLVHTYRNQKRGVEVKTIPASSLWLELGMSATTWRKVDNALAAVKKGPLGDDYEPAWIKEYAAEIAALL